MNDPHKGALTRYAYDTEFCGLLHEEAVVNYYKGLGYQVLSQSDEQTRQVFGIPKQAKAADVVVQAAGGRAIIAEVKGTNIDDAIAQLQNTVGPVRKRFPHIACKIFTSIPPKQGNSTILRGSGPFGCGYKAIRVFHAAFPGEWPLMALKPDGTAEFLRVGDEPVNLIFGPYFR